MNKIRILVAHNDKTIKDKIVDSIKNLEYVEIVGTTTDGNETYDKIINLQPEMVFTQYNMNNMNGLEIIRKSKEKLNNNIPVFNFIVNTISDKELKEAIDISGGKVNALIREPYQERVIGIMNDYKEYMNK